MGFVVCLTTHLTKALKIACLDVYLLLRVKSHFCHLRRATILKKEMSRKYGLLHDVLPQRKAISSTVLETENNRSLKIKLAFNSGQKRIGSIRAEVTEHDVIMLLLTLPCTTFPAGTGHSEIPFLWHAEPSSHELLMGTSPQHDLLLRVLIKAEHGVQ